MKKKLLVAAMLFVMGLSITVNYGSPLSYTSDRTEFECADIEHEWNSVIPPQDIC